MTAAEIATTEPANVLGLVEAHVWTIEAIQNLGSTTDIETAAAIIGIGRTKAYELAKANEFPVKTLRIGRRYLIPVPAILQLLCAD